MNLLDDLLRNSGNQELDLKLKQFLQFLVSSAGEGGLPPVNYWISKLSVDGQSEEEACKLRVTIEVIFSASLLTSCFRLIY
jgi:hypothetical protein